VNSNARAAAKAVTPATRVGEMLAKATKKT
jgi:hypothetical protein